MRMLIFSVSGLLMLAIHVKAQQRQESPQPVVTVSNKITSHINTNIVVSPELNVNVDTKQSTSIQDQAPQKIKLFTKSFTVDKNDKINLSNQYGALTIKTWDKNEIKVDAEIKAFANTDAAAQKLLDVTTINVSKAGDLISCITDIDIDNNWSTGSKKREVKVYMTVYMPATNMLKATQEYGDIVMGDYSGTTSLTVEYGALTTGDLKSTSNAIRVEYGKATIKSVNQAKISHEFGSGTTIGAAGSLTIHAEHTNIKIGSLRGRSTANLEYGKLIVDEVSASLAVTADYSTISLGFNPSFRSPLHVATNYGSFKYGTNITAKRQVVDDEDSSRIYSGNIGKGDYKSGESVSIKSEYTTIIFK